MPVYGKMWHILFLLLKISGTFWQVL